MNFTTEEKQCITRLLCEMSHADGKFELIEGEAIKRELSLDNAFIIQYSKLPFEIAMKTVAAMSEEKKTEFTRLMYVILMADGIVDTSEIAIANIFLTKMNFTSLDKIDDMLSMLIVSNGLKQSFIGG